METRKIVLKRDDNIQAMFRIEFDTLGVYLASYKHSANNFVIN